MKKKIIYILMSTVIGAITFLILLSVTETATTKKFAIHPDEVRGWECWENQDEVGIEIQTENGNFVFTKKPFTSGNVTINKE